MLFTLPPFSFEKFLFDQAYSIIWFEDHQNVEHKNIHTALCQKAYVCIEYLCLNIIFNSEDHLRYFPHIKDSRTVLYLRDNRAIGRSIITDISQLKTIFRFYDINYEESNNFI